MDESVKTILVIDDDPSIRHSFADYLEDRDYRTLLAENGLIGLEMFTQERPDLVLMDLRMPEMDGFELLHKVCEITQDTPLIVISGTARISDAIDALLKGAWDFLLKPVTDLSVLEHTVEKNLERAHLLRENKAYQENLEHLVKQRTSELEYVNDQLNTINQRLHRVVKSTTTLTLCYDLKQFAVQLLEEFAQHMEASGGSIYLVEDNYLKLLHALDPSHAPDLISFPIPQGTIIHQLLVNKKPLLLQDVEDLGQLKSSGWNGYADGSVLIFPVLDDAGEVGVILTLHNKLTPPFIEQDKEIGAILASYSCESLRAIRSYNALSISERRFRDLADMLPQSVFEMDGEGNIFYGNQMALKSFAYTAENLSTGLQILELIVPHDRKRFENNIMTLPHAADMEYGGNEYEAIRKDGSSFQVLIYFDLIMDGTKIGGTRLVIVDITFLKQQEKKIQYQAHFDSLTRLPNRFLTLDRLSQQILEAHRNKEKIAVLFLDLDDFKKVNDTLGHETGDKLLINVAERLQSIVREGDTVGRLGGDEFIILLGRLESADDVIPVVENLITQFRKMFKVDGRELLLTLSIGISIFPEDGSNTSELLRNADSAMYHSKKLGRDTFSYFTGTMNHEISRKLSIEEQIHGALEREEFEVFYQPQFDLSNNQLMGAEALLRWKNQSLGNVPPDEFISIAEQTGIIIPIGQFVLTEALSMSRQWHQNFNNKFRIAVNLSPRQLRDRELLSFIKQSMQQHSVSGECLEMEITEGVLMNEQSYITDALTGINNLGVSIAMDDFGTGFSSLSYLRKYPFDVLKIDRSFVNDIITDPADRELIQAIIAMSHALKLKVVAEGVETNEQLSYLKQLGCDYAQGYLLGKPMPAAEMTALLQSESNSS